MLSVYCSCLFCWCAGSAFCLSAVMDWRLSHIRYLSETSPGKMASRILTGIFGLIVIGIGILLWLARNIP